MKVSLNGLELWNRALTSLTKVPPFLRNNFTRRASRFLWRTGTFAPYVSSNLGISNKLDCLVPSNDDLLLFGKPNLYSGERGAIEICQTLVEEVDCFLDIGAHAGYFTFCVQHASTDLPIFAFEPDPDLFGTLAENITRNNLDSIEVINAAISSESGQATFHKNLTSPLSGSLTNSFSQVHETVEIDVDTIAYSDFSSARSFTKAMVKVDLENAEAAFIEGIGESLNTIEFLIIELLQSAHDQQLVTQLIQQHGFQAYYIDDYNICHSRVGEFTYHRPEYNWLFCRYLPFQLSNLLRNNPKLKVQP